MIKMKNILLLGMVFTMVCCTKVSVAQLSYQTTPVVADGSLNDWKYPLPYSNKTYTFTYNITNDDKNIYFVGQSNDWRMIKRILKQGITLYFDPKGKESKNKMFITFPEEKPDLSNLLKDADSTTQLNTLVLQSDAYDAENFLNVDNGQYGVADKTTKIQLALKASLDSGLVYEAIVPIETVLKDGLANASNLRKSISVGFTIHADESWKTPSGNGVKNNDNTASAFRNDNNSGGFGSGGGKGGLEKMGTKHVYDNTSKYSVLNPSKHDMPEEQWHTFSFAKGN